MPIVTCYEHPRYSALRYSLSDKDLYIDDLRKEAFGNLSLRYNLFKSPALLEKFNNTCFSFSDVIDFMNCNKKDIVRLLTCNWTGDADRFIRLWRLGYYTHNLVTEDYISGITYNNKNVLKIIVRISDMGFLTLGSLTTTFSVLEGDAFNIVVTKHYGSMRLLIKTRHPDMVKWGKDVLGKINNFRTIAGETPSDFIEQYNFVDTYGKIKFY